MPPRPSSADAPRRRLPPAPANRSGRRDAAGYRRPGPAQRRGSRRQTLSALGATAVFGIPGQHALGLFDALSRSSLHFVSSRVENNSAFAADGFSRATGEVGVLFLSTGPGALTSLAGLQEAYATGVPMVVVASQVPLEGLGARRKGMLHQLDDQKASAANVTKSQRLIQHASGIPSAIQDAWTEAISSPAGPVWIEIPQNVLLDPVIVPPVEDALAEAADNPPRTELVKEAVKWLAAAERPAIIAGGGTRRGKAGPALLSLAEKLHAPVVCTPGGNGAFPWNHELSLRPGSRTATPPRSSRTPTCCWWLVPRWGRSPATTSPWSRAGGSSRSTPSRGCSNPTGRRWGSGPTPARHCKRSTPPWRRRRPFPAGTGRPRKRW